MHRRARASQPPARQSDHRTGHDAHDEVAIEQILGRGLGHAVIGHEHAREQHQRSQWHRDREGWRGDETRQRAQDQDLGGEKPGRPEPGRLPPQKDRERLGGKDPHDGPQHLRLRGQELIATQRERELPRRHDGGDGQEMREEGRVPHRRPVRGGPRVAPPHPQHGQDERGRAAPGGDGRGHAGSKPQEHGALRRPGEGDPRSLEG